MKSRLGRNTLALLALFALLPIGPVFAQGVTTGNITGYVTDAQQQAVPGASVVALHVPSGTSYDTTTNAEGRFFIPGMRVGGPYQVTVSLSGFQTQVQENITLSLGVAQDLAFGLKVAAVEETITVSAQSDPIL